MKLQVGLIAHSLQWEELLRQEGVSWTVVDLASQEINSHCSMLIINRVLTQDERHLVEQYLKQGGGILGFTGHLSGVAQVLSRSEPLEYLIGDRDSVFTDIQLIDFAREGTVPCEANHLRSQANSFAVFAGELAGGIAVILPFDVETVMDDLRSVTKNFYFTVDRLPAERVSLVSKGEVRHLIRQSLEFLHHKRGVPYVHLWYFPNGQRNLFAFRIDTDGSQRQEVDELYRLARSSDIGMTWFLDVKSHEAWLQHFSFMVGQEMGVHCHEHQTYPTYDANLKNLHKARHLMEMAGLQPAGMAAPFGMWNPELARALDDLKFEYSSEFSFAYDTFPLFPVHRQWKSKTLQVPIHPICIGSLRKVNYSETRMMEYFSSVIEQKVIRNEPLFFYHHPSHKMWRVVESIFSGTKKKGIENTTFLEYARWWKRRMACRPSVEFADGILDVNGVGGENESVWLRVSEGHREAVVPFSEKISLPDLPWSSSDRGCVGPADLRRSREFDTRTLMAELYTKLQRKFR